MCLFLRVEGGVGSFEPLVLSRNQAAQEAGS